MGYKMVNEENIYQVFRRWHAGQSISRISETEHMDRKTIRSYVRILEEKGYSREASFPDSKELYCVIQTIIRKRKSRKGYRDMLIPYEDEIRLLVNDRKEPVKPKTAYEILCDRDGLDISYSTFKRFVQERGIMGKRSEPGIRIELPAGLEVQIDYGHVGSLFDPITRKNRTVYAFCGVLSYSRLLFVQFVFSQDQRSFVSSVIDMFEFYGGVTEIISIDNLKSGVLKADLWDPKLNQSFREMAEHYGVFIDPCRVARPKDKGKVERQIPVAREQFRKLKRLNPTATIHELNRACLAWCRDEYGMREHGTTKQMPLVLYEEYENVAMKPLPAERFVIPRWKQVLVHPDQFFEYDKKRYSLPALYRGKKVLIRDTGSLLQVFYEHSMIRQYMYGNTTINVTPEDFPEVVREMINGDYPCYLMQQAKQYGDIPAQLIMSVLKPHAYINARRAQGMLRVMREYHQKSFFTQVCQQALDKRVILPKTLKKMFDHEDAQLQVDMPLARSPQGNAMVRDISDFL